LLRIDKSLAFFLVIGLALLVFALGFAAKHGQFESANQHGHFLSKSVKMEGPAHELPCSPAVLLSDPIQVVSHNSQPSLLMHELQVDAQTVAPINHSLPLLV
jgi:hypothetical protein